MAEIADNVPIPPARTATKYPFGDLAVGQSFAAPKDKQDSIFSLVSRYSKDGKRFTSRVGDSEIRVWRTA